PLPRLRALPADRRLPERRAGDLMSAHLGEGDAERLVQGAVTDAERQAYNTHTLGCAACHRRVIAAAHALLSHGTSVFDAPDDAPSAPTPALDGSTLFGGRYI